jgi:hypothetical protein
MFSLNRVCVAGAIVSAVLMASGCGVSGGMQGSAEVRIATRIEAGSPKLVVAGPARLLHVDVHGRQLLNLYSVKRGADGTVNCLEGARTQVRLLRQGASNELNIVVASDEAICLANDATVVARDTDVAWHARCGAEAAGTVLHASND